MPATASTNLFVALLATHGFTGKISVFTTYSVAGTVMIAIDTVGGLLSDRPSSRFGKRVAWLLGAALLSAIALTSSGLASNLWLVATSYAYSSSGSARWSRRCRR